MLCLVKLWTKLKYKINVRLASNKKDSSNSRLIFTEADSLLSEVKTVYNYQNFSKGKEMFDFSNYSAKSNYYDDSIELIPGKMKDETTGFVINKFVGLNQKVYSLLVDYISQHKKNK